MYCTLDRRFDTWRLRAFASTLLLAALALSLPATSGASPIISELFYDAVGSDDAQVFVEIAGAPGTVLDGLFLEGINGSNGASTGVFALTGVIPADGLFVLADVRSDGTTDVPGADLLLNFDFQNGPDSVLLRSDFEVFDAVGYGGFDEDDVFAGEGLPIDDPAAGWSLARVFADVDSDDNSLDFIALDVPTPGAADFRDLPEPGTPLMLGVSIGVLAWVRRRRSGV
jgi:hypothetical protein